jgi:hypothetical protein
VSIRPLSRRRQPQSSGAAAAAKKFGAPGRQLNLSEAAVAELSSGRRKFFFLKAVFAQFCTTFVRACGQVVYIYRSWCGYTVVLCRTVVCCLNKIRRSCECVSDGSRLERCTSSCRSRRRPRSHSIFYAPSSSGRVKRHTIPPCIV